MIGDSGKLASIAEENSKKNRGWSKKFVKEQVLATYI